jgi:histone-lysine N-methyltransferase SETD3
MALTDTLREKQGPSPSQLPPREEGFEPFYQWLKAHNAEFDKVEVGSFGGVGYGVKAKADIEMGERVMRIPEKLMMTSETAKTSQLGPLIARDRMLQVMPNVALALHLLNERYNPKSFWKPYIDILPTSFSLPLWFNKSQLELLTGSPCLPDALQHVRSVGKLYSHLHKLLRAHGDTSFYLYSVGFFYEDFVWAVSAVMSRQNEVPHGTEGEKQSKLALIPLWDMCNHWLGTISTDFNTELRACDCFSPNAVRAGKELRIFYGARSNAELFLHQGFVYPPNTGDTLRIKLGSRRHLLLPLLCGFLLRGLCVGGERGHVETERGPARDGGGEAVETGTHPTLGHVQPLARHHLHGLQHGAAGLRLFLSQRGPGREGAEDILRRPQQRRALQAQSRPTSMRSCGRATVSPRVPSGQARS